jgi:uncharacterized membrane protein YeaQ/YmgE (transglycosylase-associated protein family)
MGYITWIVLGGLAGWLGSIIMGNNADQGLIGNIIAGVVGAFIGGYIMTFLGGAQVSGLNLQSVLVATLGAVVFIWAKKQLL